ncbi:hypothetical protein Dsin_021540 [Dipteronia sinensis]|uniref:CCHC-type domain-containing protein n=1 Tax=Dipteronia sinensis TaxID=43782 RepID=A0AAE0A0C6_9ROSI|nr:hypothetical protein Dsin_021540 [Dipteronia sinensis]
MWPTVDTDVVLPPPYETQPGRPKLQRKREDGEKAKGARSETVICKLCGIAGHNKRTCKSNKSLGKQKNQCGTKRGSSSQQPHPTTASTTSETPTMPHSTSGASSSYHHLRIVQ